MLGMNRYRLRSRTGWNTLPLELQLNVHRLLPVRDLKSAVLVNKDWNRVGEDPSLWSWVVVKVRSREDIAKLSVKRLARLREIQIEPDAIFGTADWELFFQNLEKLAQVKDIRGLGFRDLKGVDSSLLARALNGVEHVKLWRTELSVQQLNSIFFHILEQDTKIKKMELGYQDLKDVDSGLLARAVTGVEHVQLWDTRLTVEQLTSILFHILEQNTKIKKLELHRQDLKAVDSGLLARAVTGLEDVKLWGWGSELTSQQLSSIFHRIAEVDTKIKKLSIRGPDLSAVPSDDLSAAVGKLECVGLFSTKLTTAQLTSMMQHIVEKETKMKKLVLDCSNISITSVDSSLLARAVNRLEDVELRGWHSKLTSHQITSIFKRIAEVDTNIKKLSIRGLDLSGVPSDDLALAVSKLECVHFHSKLTTAQVTTIMLNIVEKETKIEILKLERPDLSAVDGNLLNSARNKLSESGGIITFN